MGETDEKGGSRTVEPGSGKIRYDFVESVRCIDNTDDEREDRRGLYQDVEHLQTILRIFLIH